MPFRTIAASRTLIASLLLAGSLLPGLVGCEAKTSDRDIVWVEPAEALTEGSKQRGLFGSGGTKVVWLDPRLPAEYEKEHIEGAINMPFATISDEAATRLSGYDAFIVYGTDYADPIAASASKRLMEMRFKRVFTLRGGLRAWKRDGQPVVSGGAPDGTKQ
ncbi:MAG: rhodanese-like domain-containing protein [Phycisphaerales bacterium]|jgi:rhodanese-related sulfurtransferase